MTYVLSNLDFEYTWDRWERKGSARAPKKVLAVAQRWESILRLVAPNACALPAQDSFEQLSKDVAHGRRLIVWGWTAPVLQKARQLQLHTDAPAPEVVRQVNSKIYSHRLERRLGIGLQQATMVRTTIELEQRLEDFDGPWLLKHPWGVSGRRQRRGSSPTPSRAVLSWAKARFEEGTPLLLEPRLDVEREFSLHFDIAERGDVELLGHCQLLTDRRGTFRGVTIGPGLEVPDDIIAGARRAAHHVAGQGYFGPLGIDAMIGKYGHQGLIRPLTELNARYTFGRLGLELWHRIDDEVTLTWHHPARSEERPRDIAPWSDDGQTGRFYLPDDADPDAGSGTWIQLEASSG